VKPRHMLTWMLWSAAVCLSSQGHGQALDLIHHDLSQGTTHFVSQGTTSVVLAHRTPLRTINAAPEVDPMVAASALTLFLGGLALVRARWTSRRGGRG
jgi:hypothetical protein